MKSSTLLIVAFIMVVFIFPIVAAILTPPDVISQVVLMSVMTLIGGILAFIISRFRSFAQTPQSIQRMIIVLVCLLSITAAYSATSFMATIERAMNAPPGSSFDGNFRFGNLWIGSSSGGGGVSVVCSVDSPNTYTVGGKTNLWMLTFPGSNSIEFNFTKNQAVWIDELHRVTFLGPVLNKDDLSLMRSHGRNVELTILSPDDLLAVLEKFRDT